MSSGVNVFDVIGAATRRPERFHSQLLGELLKGFPSFRSAFLQQFLPREISKAELQENSIHFECLLDTNERVDLVLDYDHWIVGIEIKTSDKSSRDKQLASYFAGLKDHKKLHIQNNKQIFILYLTPFSKDNQPKNIDEDKIHAINHFNTFQDQKLCECKHINWDDVRKLYNKIMEDQEDEDTRSMLRQHARYIEETICSMAQFNRSTKPTKLSRFFGEDAVEKFWRHLKEGSVIAHQPSREEELKIHLDGSDRRQAAAVLKAIIDLFDSDQVHHSQNPPKNALHTSSDAFRAGSHQAFFEDLFREVDARPNIWLRGKSCHGIMARIKGFDTPVSVCTINADGWVIIKLIRDSSID